MKSFANFHLVEPQGRYRTEAERQIREAGCRTRTDSVRLVETVITASPEFFQNKSMKELRAFFREALEFIKQKQNPNTIISAVVHMVKRFPELERSVSASETGRDYIPPRVFKGMTRLNKQREKLEGLLSEVNAFNAKAKAAEIGKVLDKYIPSVEKMSTQVRKYSNMKKSRIYYCPSVSLLRMRSQQRSHPDDGSDVTMNLRADDSFVEDEGWHRASAAYADFLRRHEGLHLLFLEIGVGGNTPVIIKYPFWQMTNDNKKAVYACLNYNEAVCPKQIEDRSIVIDSDSGAVIKQLL